MVGLVVFTWKMMCKYILQSDCAIYISQGVSDRLFAFAQGVAQGWLINGLSGRSLGLIAWWSFIPIGHHAILVAPFLLLLGQDAHQHVCRSCYHANLLLFVLPHDTCLYRYKKSTKIRKISDSYNIQLHRHRQSNENESNTMALARWLDGKSPLKTP